MTEFILALLISLFVAPLLGRLAPALGLLDQPRGHREHTAETPLVGGLAMYAAFALTAAILLEASSFKGLLLGGGLLVAVGALDDRHELPPIARFAAQIVAVGLVIYIDRVQLHDLGGLFTGQPMVLGRWSVLVTVFAMVGVINAINMSDGIDGLAGSVAALILVFLWLFQLSQYQGVVLCLLGAVIGFLIWNLRLGRSAAKLFMGDAGSMFLGLCIGWLLVAGSQGEARLIQPVSALWLVALPLWDAVAVLLVRPVLGRSPFEADRSHYHHMIMSRGFSINKTLGVVIAVSTLLGLLGVMCLRWGAPENLQFFGFMGLFACYSAAMFKYTRRPAAE